MLGSEIRPVSNDSVQSGGLLSESSDGEDDEDDLGRFTNQA